jgi:hypothetical protein
MKHRKNGAIGGNSLRMVKQYFPKVETVEDATKSAIVEVTAAHLAKAVRKNHRVCALAIACKEFFTADGIIIGLTTAWVIKENVAYRYHLGDSISREITSFDRGAPYDIGFYQLCPISPAARLGTIRSTKPRSGKATGSGAKKFRHYTRNVRTTLGHTGVAETA